VRYRLYFKTAPGDDTSLRVLECKKNNYGPVNEKILLRWNDGVYVREPGTGTLQRMAAEAEADHLFLKLLRRFNEQGRNVSDKTGTSYAPAQFAKQKEAKSDKVTSKALAEAMERLFTAGRIKVLTEGPPSHPRTRLIEPSTDPSTDLPPPSTGVCVAPPYTPHAAGSGQAGGGSPPAPNGKGIAEEPDIKEMWS
jgi:hypothetical protein